MIKLKKNYFTSGEVVNCIRSTVLNDTKCRVKLEIARVDKYYDYILLVEQDGNIKGGNLCFNFPIKDEYVEGLYYFLSTVVLNEKGDILLNVGRLKEEKVFFTVNNSPSKEENLMLVYKNIVDEREKRFNTPVTNLSYPGDNIFEAIIFCKDLYVHNNVTYEQVEIIPYKNLKYLSELDYINSFFKEYDTDIKIDERKLSILESHDRPSAVLHIPTIQTSTLESAGLIAIDMAKKLVDLYTLFRKSHGEIWGIYIVDRITYKKYFKFIGTGYKGNLLEGMIGGEDCNKIRDCFESLISNSHSSSIYLKLLNEYIKEDNRLMKYYRLWNILEGLGRDKSILNQLEVDWTSKKIKNRKGKSNKIKAAKQIVFELLRINFASLQTEIEFLNGVAEISCVSDFLDICYQRRNCCVHRGKCLKDNLDICDRDDNRCNLCREYMDYSHDYDILSDKILLKLEEVCFKLLKKELNISRNNDEVELRQHIGSSQFVEV